MSLDDLAKGLIERARQAEGRAVARKADKRITDPATHPRRYVSLVVAADYLEVDRKTLNTYLDAGLLPFTLFKSRRRILVTDLVAFEDRQRVGRKAV